MRSSRSSRAIRLCQSLSRSRCVRNEAAPTSQDLHVQRMRAKDVDFSSEFDLVASKDGTVRAFCIWFDTFFTRDGELVDSLALERGQLPSSVTAFSTSPRGTPTHWKQASFVLRDPLPVKKGACSFQLGLTSPGSKLSGRLDLKKSVDNSRELEVTVDFSPSDQGQRVVQMWRVR